MSFARYNSRPEASPPRPSVPRRASMGSMELSDSLTNLAWLSALGSNTNTNTAPTRSPGEYKGSDARPPFSYASLITKALLSSNNGTLTFNDLCEWIATHFPFYRMADPSWQTAVRHALSLNKCFRRVSTPHAKPLLDDRSSLWALTEEAREAVSCEPGPARGRNLKKALRRASYTSSSTPILPTNPMFSWHNSMHSPQQHSALPSPLLANTPRSLSVASVSTAGSNLSPSLELSFGGQDMDGCLSDPLIYSLLHSISADAMPVFRSYSYTPHSPLDTLLDGQVDLDSLLADAYLATPDDWAV
eukprot:comp12546_c0_seq1/m.7538 comp12546_c0_seq1/g.7538  ORF comp12546_c0_seq1/g.7538 comp12546_c0_seq1/m.7538 type:complete len:303 (-) comp12546_c0_seq1:180-1088(-)